MHEHHFTVPRTTRYFTLGQADHRLSEVWFVCHGYGQLASDFLQLFAALDNGTRLIVAPEGLSRYYTNHARGEIGASWMTREERLAEVSDYVRYLDRLYEHVFQTVPRSSVSVRVLGFSQGGATAARWVSLGRAIVDRLIVWGEGLPPDLDLEMAWGKFEDSRLTLVVGTDDPYIDETRLASVEARLMEHEIPYETVRYDGGHYLDGNVLRSLAAT
jgi:predicted esterase